MAKAIKAIVAKKVIKAIVEKPVPIAPPVNKKVQLTKKEMLAKVLLNLPKAGMTVKEITEKSGMNAYDVPLFARFAAFLGVCKEKDGKFYNV